MATNEGYYAKVVKESSGKYTMATEEIERDLHRYIHCAEVLKHAVKSDIFTHYNHYHFEFIKARYENC